MFKVMACNLSPLFLETFLRGPSFKSHIASGCLAICQCPWKFCLACAEIEMSTHSLNTQYFWQEIVKKMRQQGVCSTVIQTWPRWALKRIIDGQVLISWVSVLRGAELLLLAKYEKPSHYTGNVEEHQTLGLLLPVSTDFLWHACCSSVNWIFSLVRGGSILDVGHKGLHRVSPIFREYSLCQTLWP